MTERRGPLRDVLVVERAGRLAVAACGHLLAALGARVVRIETTNETEQNAAIERLMRGGKEVVVLGDDRTTLNEWLSAADVVLLESISGDDAVSRTWQALTRDESQRTIVAAISPSGLKSSDLPADADDVLVQAACGLMAVTGEDEDSPQYVHVPVAELTGAVIALNAVLAALRVQRRDGVGQLVDVSLVEAMADQLRTHVGLVGAGTTRGFRIGCRHPVVSPWNVYRARDGWVMICAPSDANWRAILGKMGREDLQDDPRHAGATNRRRNVEEVDALLQHWIGEHTIEHVVTAMTDIDAPAGPALGPAQVAEDPLLIECGTVQRTASGAAPRLGFQLSRSALTGLAGLAIETSTVRPERSEAESKGERVHGSTSPRYAHHERGDGIPRLPLDGVRVIELTRYAAGPLAGYLLSSLGAEVIKIEPPGGEDTRGWAPRFGAVSGYFSNFNAGKRLVCLDLKEKTERERLHALLAGADVLLHNMRPGAMEKLGLGADVVTARYPALIYSTISGYGLHGPKLPALDTVIQARVGLTALTGDGEQPLRIGYSMADQLAGHFATAGIMAALEEREASGLGQTVDVAMTDAIAWLTHPAWNGEPTERTAHCRVRTADGWVVAAATTEQIAQGAPDAATLSRAVLVQQLADRGIRAAAMLEVDEVLSQPELRARRSVYDVETDGGAAPVFVAPFGLTRTPVRRGARVANVGEDNHELVSPAPGRNPGASVAAVAAKA